MSDIFLKVLNMSISAGWIVLVVLLLRLLFKKMPKWITVLLWSMVAIRLVCPFSIKSAISLIPSAQTVSPDIMTQSTPEINTGIPVVNDVVNPIIAGSFAPAPAESANPLQILIPVLALCWVAGMTVLALYALISYMRIKTRVKNSELLRENIYVCEKVGSPFVLGMIRPKIYLPLGMNQQDREHVVAHETAHIYRKDHLWKPFGFLILILHWFNPLIWVAYILLCRDIELACDEKVIKELDFDGRADYSQALLNCSVGRRNISACPLAFGEVGVKERVKSVLNYKKPAFWLIVSAVAVIAVTALCVLTDPETDDTVLESSLDAFLDTQIMEYYNSKHTGDNFIAVSKSILGVDEIGKETKVYAWVLCREYILENDTVKEVSGSHIPTVFTVKKKDNEYELAEYWIPRDGKLYAADIKDKFPHNLCDEAMDSQKYIKTQEQQCLHAAEVYYKKAITGPNDGEYKVYTVEFEKGNGQLPENAPSLSLWYGQAKYEALKGTFNWASPGKDGIINATTADCLPPFDLESKKYMPKLEYIASEEISAEDVKKVYLQFDTLPSKVTVNGRGSDAWGDYDNKGSEPVAMKPYYSGTDNPQIVLYLEDDIAIYEIVASWEGENGTGGIVRYSFYTQD